MARVRGKITVVLISAVCASPRLFAGAMRAPELPIDVHFAVASATPNGWQLLLHKIGKDGEFFERSGDISARFELKNIHGPERAPHRADYIDIWGDVDRQNRFHPGYVRLVSENWRPFKASDPQNERTKERCGKESCLYIDQWIFTLDLDGKVFDFIHDATVENSGMDIFESLYFRPTDREAKATLAPLLTAWDRYTPAPR